MDEEELSVGDPVEVKFSVRGSDGEIEEQWYPATVVRVNKKQIGVAFATGVRQMFDRRLDLIRKTR